MIASPSWCRCIQQATIDYLTDPAETNQLILDAVAAINNGWVYTPGVADYAVQTMINDGLIANGTDGVLGSFDADSGQQPDRHRPSRCTRRSVRSRRPTSRPTTS